MQNARLREKRIVILSVLILIAAFIISLINRQAVLPALQNAIVFAVWVCLLLILLHLGASLAERKGYPTWLGVAAAFFLNVVGLIILVILPGRLTLDDGDKP